jgi:KUP system potassium uptake protein
VTHTAAEAEGQIYVPELNGMLAVACVALVLIFKESAKLANAFGLAVSGTMLITAFAFFSVTRRTWGWSLGKALPVLLLFLCFDVPFVIANAMKFIEGGFVPVVVGTVFFAVMVIWRRGRALLAEHMRSRTMPLAEFKALIEQPDVSRPPGGSIFLTGHDADVPPIVALNVRRLRALQEHLMLLTVRFEHTPYVEERERASARDEGDGITRATVRYGYMEKPDLPAALAPLIAREKLPFALGEVTYLLGRETIVAGPGGQMSAPVERVFGFLARNARSASAYFQLPHEQVVEIGIQVDL